MSLAAVGSPGVPKPSLSRSSGAIKAIVPPLLASTWDVGKPVLCMVTVCPKSAIHACRCSSTRTFLYMNVRYAVTVNSVKRLTPFRSAWTISRLWINLSPLMTCPIYLIGSSCGFCARKRVNSPYTIHLLMRSTGEYGPARRTPRKGTILGCRKSIHTMASL
jgi:hypothetical protein